MTKANQEVETGTALANLDVKSVIVAGSTTESVTVGGVTFAVKRAVNVPTLKHETGDVVLIRIDQPLERKENEIEKDVTIGGVKQKATETNILHIARVTEYTSQAQFEYVCNAMTADNIQSAYPDASYVGKWFAIRKGGTVAGKRYKDVQIVEIEPTGEG